MLQMSNLWHAWLLYDWTVCLEFAQWFAKWLFALLKWQNITQIWFSAGNRLELVILILSYVLNSKSRSRLFNKQIYRPPWSPVNVLNRYLFWEKPAEVLSVVTDGNVLLFVYSVLCSWKAVLSLSIFNLYAVLFLMGQAYCICWLEISNIFNCLQYCTFNNCCSGCTSCTWLADVFGIDSVWLCVNCIESNLIFPFFAAIGRQCEKCKAWILLCYVDALLMLHVKHTKQFILVFSYFMF